MPTNQNSYNSRVTDEALEKRFRDTFRSQGGSELVDDLYASGVIIPVVDFTSAAEGSQLGQNLQTAWDFTTGLNTVSNANTTIISNSGFWQIDVVGFVSPGGGVASVQIDITDGLAVKPVWKFSSPAGSSAGGQSVSDGHFVVFLRAGDSVIARAANTQDVLNVWYRQIADVSGNLTNPSGFTSS